MRISAINYQINPNFTGEGNKKSKLKTAAGAAAIAIATAAPISDAEAQVYFPRVIPRTYPTVPAPAVTSVPNCFVIGDLRNFDYNKSMREVFDEIDANGNENGVISAKEVIRTERNNWNMNNLYPYNTYQMRQAEAQFNALSELYNEDDSDPNTINYKEYKSIMKDFMETKNINNFINLIKVFTIPGFVCPPPPHHHHVAPPPHHKGHRH